MKHKDAVVLILLWSLVVAAALFCRPLLPRDETRYVSVAWEMWHGGDFLVPRINGTPYSHKPPLLFYLIHFGWLLFGVNEWSARLTGPVFGLFNLFLAAGLARRLWPGIRGTSRVAPFMLLAMPLYAVLTTFTMFDMLLCFFVLVAASGLWMAGWERAGHGWLLVGAGIGGGLLAKGPVCLLFVVPLGLLAPWWLKDRAPKASWRQWYTGLLAAVLAGAGIALAWAIPAARAGGPEYGRAILWGQTAGRVVESFAHQRPWWWYLPFAFLVTLPWSYRILPFKRLTRPRLDPGERFCLLWLGAAFALLSLASGKQLHYLIPLLPPAALLLARRLAVRDPASPLRAEVRIMAGLYLAIGTTAAMLPLWGSSWERSAPYSQVSVGWGAGLMAVGLLLFFVRPRNVTAAAKTVCFAMTLLIAVLHVGFLRQWTAPYDVGPMAGKIAELQRTGRTVAVYPETFANQFSFAGRLDPVVGIPDRQGLEEWIRKHPRQYVVLFSDDAPPAQGVDGPICIRPFSGEWTSLWQARALERDSPARKQAHRALPPKASQGSRRQGS